MSDRAENAASGWPGDGVFFKLCPLKWCILMVYFSYYFALQLTNRLDMDGLNTEESA